MEHTWRTGALREIQESAGVGSERPLHVRSCSQPIRRRLHLGSETCGPTHSPRASYGTSVSERPVGDASRYPPEVLALDWFEVLLEKHPEDDVTESPFWLNRGALITTYGLRPARREDDVL